MTDSLPTETTITNMAYKSEPIPYDKPTREMTDGALKRAFLAVTESMPRRVENISRYLLEEKSIEITARSSDEDIDKLPKLIADLGGLRDPQRAIVGHVGGAFGLTLTPETVAMVFDGALLWGEMFRHRYPEAKWAVGAKPNSSVDYGDPVLIGPYQYLSEFGVRGQLYGFVGCVLFGSPDRWTLSEITKLRAFDLGLAPDPRRRVMP